MIKFENVKVMGREPMLYLTGSSDRSSKRKIKQPSNFNTEKHKFMQTITVYVDITAPLYWWNEFNTYKVGIIADMHQIQEKEFTIDDFSREYIDGTKVCVKRGDETFSSWDVLKSTIDALNYHREQFLKARENIDKSDMDFYCNSIEAKYHWWQMIQLLPSSYNPRQTVIINYDALENIYKSNMGPYYSKNQMDEWFEFYKWIENLPDSELITGININKYDWDFKERRRIKYV